MKYIAGKSNSGWGKFLFIGVLQLINEEEMDRIRISPFATPNGIIDLGNHHQWLLISQKEKQQNIMCLLTKIQNTKTKTPIR